MDLSFLLEFPNNLICWCAVACAFPLVDAVLVSFIEKGLNYELISKVDYKPLTMKDYIILGLNSLSTVPFLVSFGKALQHMPWKTEELTFMNTVVSFLLAFVGYDLVYYWFHRFLHVKAVYPYIHKWHHGILTPSRGVLDAINTHPIEYLIGMYILIPPLYVLPIHAYTAMIFLPMSSFASCLNHTRFFVQIPFVFNSLDHDVHHRLFTYNYGQFVMLFDHIFNTFGGYYDRPSEIPDYGPVREISSDGQKKAAIIGSEGLVGHRLIEMLLERGSQQIIALDIKENTVHTDKRIKFIRHDITNSDYSALITEFKDVDVVYHVAALVGPYHAHDLYHKVNVEGTENIVNLCKKAGIQNYVYVGSPSTRFGEHELYGQHEADLPYPKTFHGEYSKTKALAEQFVMKQNEVNFHTCVISPHQVYGPRDQLFLKKFFETAKTGQLRILGHGNNLVSLTHVDNVCHALILAGNGMGPKSPVNGEWYIVTDGSYVNFWNVMNEAVAHVGLTPLKDKFSVPTAVLFPIAYVCDFIGYLRGRTLTLNSFAIRMITIHRWFKIEKIQTHLGYKPVKAFKEEWLSVCQEVYSRL